MSHPCAVPFLRPKETITQVTRSEFVPATAQTQERISAAHNLYFHDAALPETVSSALRSPVTSARKLNSVWWMPTG